MGVVSLFELRLGLDSRLTFWEFIKGESGGAEVDPIDEVFGNLDIDGKSNEEVDPSAPEGVTEVSVVPRRLGPLMDLLGGGRSNEPVGLGLLGGGVLVGTMAGTVLLSFENSSLLLLLTPFPPKIPKSMDLLGWSTLLLISGVDKPEPEKSDENVAQFCEGVAVGTSLDVEISHRGRDDKEDTSGMGVVMVDEAVGINGGMVTSRSTEGGGRDTVGDGVSP